MSLASSRLYTEACDLQHTIISLDVTRRDFRPSPLELYVRGWFTDVDGFFNYLVISEDHSVILITSNLLIDIVTYVLRPLLPQICAVYILGPPLWKNSYDKYKNQHFLDVDALLNILVRKKIQDFVTHQCFAKERSISDLTTDCARYIWYRLFFDVLTHLNHTYIARSEMLKSIRIFHSLEVQNHVKKNCEEFERSYKPEDIVRWYTRTSFFYIALNRTLRSGNINQIFAYRCVISDMERVLNELRRKQPPIKYSVVYRGQKMYLDEVTSIVDRVGDLIGMTAFWPVTFNIDVAKCVAAYMLRVAEPMERVLFTINIPAHLRHHACVDISDFSSYHREQEMIFPLHSLFRIEHVNKLKNLWQIELTLVDENDDQFFRFMHSWEMSVGLRNFFRISVAGKQQLFHDLSEDNVAFIQFQLLIDMILRLDHNDFSRDEMLEVCRAKFALNRAELAKIDTFDQTYVAKDAAMWYTKDCFLYRLLNEALQMGNIDLIVKLRCFIHDLHNQLAELQIDFFRSLPPRQPVLTLYRGLTMTMSELKKFQQNEGHLVSTNSFLSTTRDFHAALFFSGEGMVEAHQLSVVYQIFVDTNVSHLVPFAAIDYQSIFKDEDEVLFSMAAVFRIGRTKEMGERLWKIKLTLTPPDEKQWNILTKHLKKNSLTSE